MVVLSAAFIAFDVLRGIAHGAHLGGTLFGAAFVRWFRGAEFGAWWRRLRERRRSRPIVKVRFPKADSTSWESESGGTRSVTDGDFISKEVDPILDKISAHGIHSLTPRERQILEAARAKMAKR